MKVSVKTISCTAILLGANFFIVAQEPTLPPAATRPVDFGQDVEPLFSTRCYGCHGPQQQMSGLRLDRAEDALRGGYSGAVIQPGKSAESRLIRLVAGTEKGLIMPMGKQRLTPEEVGILRAWIDQGAKWRTGESGRGAQARPIREIFTLGVSTCPSARKRRRFATKAGFENPIDSFVLARLEAENLAPSPEAGKETLIRRLSLDLTGLPPTPEPGQRLSLRASSDAYERVVDCLVGVTRTTASKWARHWLDLARYADSDGYEQDAYRPMPGGIATGSSTRFNRDKPFDQFTIEQIAGDLLPNATTEQKIATGFHRNTLDQPRGRDRCEQFRFEQVDRPRRTPSARSGWA